MKYGIYKFVFPYGVHFGNKMLEQCTPTFKADTLFSALCQEALKDGDEQLHKLFQFVQEGKMIISDAFPFVDSTFLLPKPYLPIHGSEEDRSKKKKYKKMKYVALTDWDSYVGGNCNPEAEIELEKRIGKTDVKTSVAIRGLEEPKPYGVGAFYFYQDAGLYIVYGVETDEADELLADLLEKLSFVGIGGKRSAGYGRFDLYNVKLPDELQKLISKDGKRGYVSLSTSLPREDELDSALDGAFYMTEKRSGFVDSAGYSDTYMKKRNLFVLAAGSVFQNKYQGDVYDVADGGKHPVYRYAKPLFIGV